MELPGLGAAAGAVEKKRGRPKGSTNKRSEDLVRYIAHQYGGLTPGQQAAAIGMVTPRELKAVAKSARAARLDPVVVAMAMKAKTLATFLGITAGEAWELMRKERAELMPYVHQKRPAQVELQGGPVLPMIVMAPSAPGAALLEGEWSEVDANQQLNDMRPVEVAQSKSHDLG